MFPQATFHTLGFPSCSAFSGHTLSVPGSLLKRGLQKHSAVQVAYPVLNPLGLAHPTLWILSARAELKPKGRGENIPFSPLLSTTTTDFWSPNVYGFPHAKQFNPSWVSLRTNSVVTISTQSQHRPYGVRVHSHKTAPPSSDISHKSSVFLIDPL